MAGVGHSGLLTARLLADHGLRIALMDKHPDPRTVEKESADRPAGSALSVNLGEVVALRTAGFWRYLVDHARSVSIMRVTDPISNRTVLYRAAETGSKPPGEGFEILLPGGPLAFLPLPEVQPGRPSASITWVMPREWPHHCGWPRRRRWPRCSAASSRPGWAVSRLLPTLSDSR